MGTKNLCLPNNQIESLETWHTGQKAYNYETVSANFDRFFGPILTKV